MALSLIPLTLLRAAVDELVELFGKNLELLGIRKNFGATEYTKN